MRILKKVAMLISAILVIVGWSLMASAADPIKIGVTIPLTGPSADGGNRMLKSIQIAADEINTAGGVLGRKVALEVWDDETKVDKGITGIKKFMFRDNVWGVIGGYRSGVVLAQQDPIMEQKKIFMVTDAAAMDITERVGQDYNKYKYTFRSVMNVNQVGELMLPVLTDVMKAKTYFYVAETTVWSRDLAEILRKAAEAKGIKRVGYTECDPAAQEFTSELAKIKEAKPDVVLCAISGSSDVPFAKQYYEMKVPHPLCFHAAAIMLKVDLGEKGNHLSFMAYTWNIPITPKTVGFHEKFNKVHAQPDGWQDVRSYDGMHILADGIRRAGTLEPDKVLTALEKTDFVGAAGRYVFDKNHQAKWGPGFTEGLILQRTDGKDYVLYPANIAKGKFTRAPWWK